MHRALVIPEILDRIAMELYEEPRYAHSTSRSAPVADWIRLCWVCRSFWHAITPVIYRKLLIKRAEKAEALQKRLEAHPHLGQHVQQMKLYLESPRSAGLESYCHTEILKACPNITTLSVNGWAGASARRDLKKAMSTLKHLERLEISHYTLSDDESEGYGTFEALLLQCMNWPKLRVLSLQQRSVHPWNNFNNDVSDDENDPEPTPPTSSGGGWDCPEEAEYTEFYKKEDAWYLRRTERKEKSTEEMRKALDQLQNNSLPNLTTLHFGACGLSDGAIAMLARMAPNIQEVKINDNPDQVSSAAFSAALDIWSNTLHTFFLEPVEESAHQIHDALCKCSLLVDLTCSNNNLSPKAFAQHFPSLQKLSYRLPATELPEFTKAVKASKAPLGNLSISVDDEGDDKAAWTTLRNWAEKKGIKVNRWYRAVDFEEHWGFSDCSSEDPDDLDSKDDFDEDDDRDMYGEEDDYDDYNDQFSDEFDEEG